MIFVLQSIGVIWSHVVWFDSKWSHANILLVEIKTSHIYPICVIVCPLKPALANTSSIPQTKNSTNLLKCPSLTLFSHKLTSQNINFHKYKMRNAFYTTSLQRAAATMEATKLSERPQSPASDSDGICQAAGRIVAIDATADWFERKEHSW